VAKRNDKKTKAARAVKFVSMRLPEDVVKKLDDYTDRLSKEVGIPVSRTQGLVHLVRTRSGAKRRGKS
jgi:hypothetical protein